MPLDSLQTMLLERRAQRRALLKSVGIGAAGIAATSAGVLLPGTAQARRTPTLSDADIFNFALNFEYLGAEYYLAALNLPGLPAGLTGTSGGVTRPPAGTTVPFQSDPGAYFAYQLAIDEFAHVTVIREALTAEGATPIDEPAIDIGVGPTNSWSTLAVAAGLISQGEVFNPYASEIDFLLGAYVLEDVCVTALCGAAALIQNKVNLAYAGSILGVEGYQVGMIRSRLSAVGAGLVTDAISAFRSKVSNAILPGTGVDDVGTDETNGGANSGNPFFFTNVDVNGQAFRRTPQQVLGIAYGALTIGVTSGGFFPNGVNGTIVST